MRSHVCSRRGTSCSTTRMPMPRRLAVDRIAAPSSPDSRPSRPAAGSSSSSTAGSVTSARAMPTRRDTPWGREDGRSSSTSPRPNSSTSSSTSGVAARRPGRTRSTRYRQADWSSAATSRLSRTVSSSNSSTACHERTIPARARRSTDHPSMGAPSKLTEPDRGRREAGDDVEQRRLPGAVRSDEPDHLARLDLEADGVEGDDAAEGDGDVVHREGGGGRPWGRAAAGGASGRGRGSWNGAVTRCAARAHRAAVPSGAWRSTVTAPNADRIANHEMMSVPSGTTFSKRRAPSAPGAPTAAATAPETQATPPTTAYWISSTEPKTLYWPNCTLAWRNDSSAPPRAAMAAATPKAYTLAATTPIAERGGGPLVAPHGEQPDPGPAATQVGDEEADEDEHDEHEAAVALGVLERVEVDAGERHALDRQASHAAGERAVGEQQRVEHQRHGQGGDGEARSPGAHGGPGDHDPDERGARHRGEQRGLERPAVGRHEPSRHPRPDPGEGELAQRELSGVAGDDDDRRDDDGEGERGDEGVGPGVDAGEEAGTEDDPDDEREQRHPPGAGQRQPGDGLAPLEARASRHDHVAEDDRQRHGLHEPRERRRADVEPLGDVGLEQQDLALHDADQPERRRR